MSTALGRKVAECIHVLNAVSHSPSVAVPISISNEYSTVSLVEMTVDKLGSFSSSLQVGGDTQRLVGTRESTDHQPCQRKKLCIVSYHWTASRNSNLIIRLVTDKINYY